MGSVLGRPVYEPPLARDLSKLSVSGQEPLGMCTTGNRPFEECLFGPSPSGANPPCEFGFYPTAPKCSIGSIASTTCISGTAQG